MASNTQRVAYNTAVQVGARIITSAFGLFSLGITTRYLGVDLYGQLTAAAIFIGLVSSLTDAGLGTVTVREISQKKRPTNEILGTTLILRVLISIAATAIGVFLGFALYQGKQSAQTVQAILLLSTTILLATIQSSITAGLVAHLRNDLVVIGDILGKVLTFLFIVFAVRHNLGFTGIVLAYVYGAILNFATDLVFGLAKYRPKLHIDLPYWRALLRMAIPLGAAGILSTLYFRADGFMLSLMRSNAEVGLYGVAYKIIEFTMAVPVFFSISILPIIAAAHKDLARVSILNLRSLRAMNLLAAPALFGVVILSPEIARLFGGVEFAAAAVPMSILMLSNYFSFSNSVYGSTLLGINAQRRIFQVMLISLLINVAINLILIPLYGTTGAATAVVITEIVALLLMRHFHRLANIQLPSWQEHLPALGCAAVMGAGVWIVKQLLQGKIHSNFLTIVICSSVGIVLYAILGLATKTIDPNELITLVKPPPENQNA